MKVILPFRGEFGMKVYWHAPAVHAIEGEKAVYLEPNHQALYPSASLHVEVDRKDDGSRRNHYRTDAEYVAAVELDARNRFGADAEYLRPDQQCERKRFLPRPTTRQGIEPNVVVCPRKRDYGSEKNWPAWVDLTDRLVTDGLDVFAAGAADASYNVPCDRAWDYDNDIDATIEAMQSADLVVATDAGLAHLAVLCGAPLLIITHGEGLIAPGPVRDQHGKIMEPAYWPVKMHRFDEANHTGSPVELLHYAWFDLVHVYRNVIERCLP